MILPNTIISPSRGKTQAPVSAAPLEGLLFRVYCYRP